MSFAQAIVFGLVQGVTELFPISSLGHSVLLPAVLGWHLAADANAFLTFLVATHCATAVVLFLLYWSDWRRIAGGFVRSLRVGLGGLDADGRLAWLLIAGTVPAALVGLLAEHWVRGLFLAPRIAAVGLVTNGVLLLGAERLRRTAPRAAGETDADRRIAATLTWPGALGVGIVQILAFVPGLSRTGSTFGGSLLVGLSHEDALRYSFLLATPIIGAAGVLKLPHLMRAPETNALQYAAAGALAAAVAAYLAVRFLTRHFRSKTLTPFAVYCILVGAVSFVAIGR